MRPIRLSVKGFTAYRDEAVLDFEGLDVFSITGQTGSGKSSLLDAITYVLFGRVERVGDRVRQLITHGQPRMVVVLEFAVGEDRYRVAREAFADPRKASRIVLERGMGGDWHPIAGGVRETEDQLRRIVGLDYVAFTRSVLLPQGRFAEFLAGDASERRSILTELLGLSLFRRMQERANQLWREHEAAADTRAGVIEREYAGVDEAAVKEARSTRAEARKLAASLVKVARSAAGLHRRWEAERDAVRALGEIGAEVRRLMGQARSSAQELEGLSERAKAAAADFRQSASEARKADAAESRAVKAREAAEGAWGTLAIVLAARARAEALVLARKLAAEARERLREVERAAPVLDAAIVATRKELAASLKRADLAERGVSAAETGLERAGADDHVAALVAGAKVGDPCPVCGERLSRLPKRPAAGAVAKARAAVEGARRDLKAAQLAVLSAEKAAQAALFDREGAGTLRERLQKDLKERDRELTELLEELREVIGAPEPLDPLAELTTRSERLSELTQIQDAARTASQAAKERRTRAERERDRVGSAVAEEGARLEADLRLTIERAAKAAGEGFAAPALPGIPRQADAPSLAVYAGKRAEALLALAASVDEAVVRHARAQGSLVDEGLRLAGDLLPEPRSLQALAVDAEDAARAAAGRSAAAEERAKVLQSKLEGLRVLRKETAGARSNAARFRALANELKAPRIIAFLQAEALEILAAAGSSRLAALSEGRYRLVCRDDEFSVVDTWNGDEERSVRTLSGGETFLASLALALALAEQAPSLAVEQRARLESLFLDEGFGTLDADSLRAVVEAIGQLGGDGRLVGVITHVRELAEQFPRIEVEKSERGSRLRVVAT
jgi:exonuclease SbcC